MTTIFYNETGLNGKFQIMTTLNLNIPKQIKTTVVPNGIHSHKGEVYKNLHNYWVNKQGLETVKSMENSERTSF